MGTCTHLDYIWYEVDGEYRVGRFDIPFRAEHVCLVLLTKCTPDDAADVAGVWPSFSLTMETFAAAHMLL